MLTSYQLFIKRDDVPGAIVDFAYTDQRCDGLPGDGPCAGEPAVGQDFRTTGCRFDGDNAVDRCASRLFFGARQACNNAGNVRHVYAAQCLHLARELLAHTRDNRIGKVASRESARLQCDDRGSTSRCSVRLRCAISSGTALRRATRPLWTFGSSVQLTDGAAELLNWLGISFSCSS